MFFHLFHYYDCITSIIVFYIIIIDTGHHDYHSRFILIVVILMSLWIWQLPFYYHYQYWMKYLITILYLPVIIIIVSNCSDFILSRNFRPAIHRLIDLPIQYHKWPKIKTEIASRIILIKHYITKLTHMAVNKVNNSVFVFPRSRMVWFSSGAGDWLQRILQPACGFEV